MKRNNSALSLKNLAMSIKQSICLEAQRTAKREFTLLRETRSSASLKLKNESVTNKMKEIKINKEHKQNRIFILQKQITYLQKDMEANKTSIRNYSKQLGEFEDVSRKIEEKQKRVQEERIVVEQIRNQIHMLRQEIESIGYNAEERIAQKQYYQQLLQTYQNQYEAESHQVIKILQLQQRNTLLLNEIKTLQTNIQSSQNQFKEWKRSVEFDLNQHKLKNSLKIVRLQLIQYQDKCDQFCNQHSLRKLRELFCLYFKNYAKTNGISNEPVQNGIDIYICQNGLVEDFSEFLRQRLVYNKPRSQQILKYLQTLIKMEQVFRKSNSGVNNKLYSYFSEDIKGLITLKQENISEIKTNEMAIKDTMEKIDLLFNNQSIAVIQYMREQNNNKYDIKQIKNKLRENKKQQRNRIDKMKDSFRGVKQLEKTIQKQRKSTKIQANKQQIIQLQDSRIHSENVIDQLQFKLQKLNHEKDNIETIISNAISKWKQRDDNKEKLKKLYSQLRQTKEQNGFALTKNIVDSPIAKKSSPSNSKSIKKQPHQQNTKSKHSKNPSLCSSKQNKSVLSLSNPFKRIMEREAEAHQPIIGNCQMIISRKLSSKDLHTKQFACNEWKQSEPFGNNMTHNIDMRKIKKQPSEGRASNKQNDLWKIKNQTQTVTKSKYKLSIKPNPDPLVKNTKGKISESQRVSLSKLLLSKFNR